MEVFSPNSLQTLAMTLNLDILVKSLSKRTSSMIAIFLTDGIYNTVMGVLCCIVKTIYKIRKN